jgi:EAL domain-containing protein (putative c-di-GMP-specific phosphodiesterase class I)/CheY-like chemotaxis protein
MNCGGRIGAVGNLPRMQVMLNDVAPSRNAGTPSLLVIDDEVALCDYVADIARGEGLEVRACSDPAKVREHLALQADLICLDLMMPGLDGIEVLRAAADAGCSASIVLMSGFDRRVLQSAQTYGISRGLTIAATVHKPIRAADLRALLRSLTGAPPRTRTPARGTPPSKPQGEIRAEDLARGIDADELVLHYQPQVSMTDGQWAGVEALVRWQHPEFGLVMPDRFIELAESSGLALALTRAIVRRALTELQPSSLPGGFDGALSLNLPAVALTDLEFPSQMHALSRSLGWQESHVQFELTETSTSNDSPTALDILVRLRMGGFCLSIDDFGTGLSSLQRLRLLPFNELKIDMQFVRGLATDRDSAAIVQNSIALAHQLGMRVVAEGVEDERAWRLLRQMGCDFAQGYMISRPVPPASLGAWRQSWRPPAPAAGTPS